MEWKGFTCSGSHGSEYAVRYVSVELVEKLFANEIQAAFECDPCVLEQDPQTRHHGIEALVALRGEERLHT